MRDDLVVLILTHGRPDRVLTYEKLRKHGYTGPIRLLIDDEDKTADKYRSKYPGEVLEFSKREAAGYTDDGDNSGDRRAVVYARNASFGIARDLGYRYFWMLDDDYNAFSYTWLPGPGLVQKNILQLDRMLESLVEYFERIPALSIAIAQRGDFIGGTEGTFMHSLRRRKVMNSFLCSVDRPFKFVGKVNEDVSAYVSIGTRGGLFLTMSMLALNQLTTQQNPGGLTDIYLHQGTYVKSFYSVMYAPSAVKVYKVGGKGGGEERIHHEVSWPNAVPQIVRESYRRGNCPREYGPECPESWLEEQGERRRRDSSPF